MRNDGLLVPLQRHLQRRSVCCWQYHETVALQFHGMGTHSAFRGHMTWSGLRATASPFQPLRQPVLGVGRVKSSAVLRGRSTCRGNIVSSLRSARPVADVHDDGLAPFFGGTAYTRAVVLCFDRRSQSKMSIPLYPPLRSGGSELVSSPLGFRSGERRTDAEKESHRSHAKADLRRRLAL